MGPTYYPKDEVVEFINQYVRNGSIDSLYIAIRKFVDREGLHPSTAILELAKHYEDGLQKYPERNWEKGISLKCYIDSGVRHYLRYMRGDKDEPHDRAFLWNMFGAIWTHRNRPECIDLPFINKVTDMDSPAPRSDKEDFSARAERMAERIKHFRETSFA